MALHSEIRGLKSELDEAKRTASRLGQETIELRQSLEVREREKEALAQSHSQLEEARLQQEKALEKLLREVRTGSTGSTVYSTGRAVLSSRALGGQFGALGGQFGGPD